MTLLLDTHVWFWALESPGKLGRRCCALLEDPANELAVATISTLELGQLQETGRLSFAGTLESWVRRGSGSLELLTVELTHAIALLAYGLPGTFHRDPADRILVASAIQHGYTLVTADERILAYTHVLTFDARR